MQGKNVLLGVSGGIAAYKAAELAREFRREGAEVRVLMTRAATEFVTPLTFEALTGKPVSIEMFARRTESALSGAAGPDIQRERDARPADSARHAETARAQSRRARANIVQHIELARWADVFVVAPATADVMAKLAVGLADDLLSTTALACEAPLVVAPAMNSSMWKHPATQANVETLRARGATIVGPGEGELSCGETGKGRMSEPGEIAEAVRKALGG